MLPFHLKIKPDLDITDGNILYKCIYLEYFDKKNTPESLTLNLFVDKHPEIYEKISELQGNHYKIVGKLTDEDIYILNNRVSLLTELTCPICHDEIASRQEVVVCCSSVNFKGHFICTECMTSWTQIQLTCLLSRNNLFSTN